MVPMCKSNRFYLRRNFDPSDRHTQRDGFVKKNRLEWRVALNNILKTGKQIVYFSLCIQYNDCNAATGRVNLQFERFVLPTSCEIKDGWLLIIDYHWVYHINAQYTGIIGSPPKKWMVYNSKYMVSSKTRIPEIKCLIISSHSSQSIIYIYYI